MDGQTDEQMRMDKIPIANMRSQHAGTAVVRKKDRVAMLWHSRTTNAIRHTVKHIQIYSILTLLSSQIVYNTIEHDIRSPVKKINCQNYSTNTKLYSQHTTNYS